MTRQLLRASASGIREAKRAFNRTGWTQQQLADQASCKSRQPIWKFFTGKPIERYIFIEICFQLDLNWEEIAAEAAEAQQPAGGEINALVAQVRSKLYSSILQRCSTMRVLDMSKPVSLMDVYTRVHILEKIPSHRYLEIADLLQGCTPENFDRLGLGKISEHRVSGLEVVERYRKLIVLGKPGSGKTTFLKYLAIQCNEDLFQGNLVPIFVTLKDWAEAEEKLSLEDYITSQNLASDIALYQLMDIFKHGRAMILLDGLDEIRQADTRRIFKQIRDFSDSYYSNQFVITCRLAACEYTFENFTEVEVADFDSQQIAAFCRNWFQSKKLASINKFLQKLRENQPIQELATNPLLLTLLCLVFEESSDFPANRSEIYKQGLDILLKKWDAKRNIDRDLAYKNLSLQRKEGLLGHIALITFERGEYFCKQGQLEHYISDYLRNLHPVSTTSQDLQLDGEAVLKSLEAQHGLLVERAKGIYSFSHLTFQEYFTARELATTTESQAWQRLVNHLTEPRWRDVFLLTVGMLRNASELILIMKKATDKILAGDEKLQQVLSWGNQKSLSVNLATHSSSVRAFYFALNLALDLGYLRVNPFWLRPISDFAWHRLPCLEIDRTLTRALTFARGCCCGFPQVYPFALYTFYSCDYALNLVAEMPLKESLQQLIQRLPHPDQAEANVTQWWEIYGQDWAEQLRLVMVKYLNIGHNWQFNELQQKALAIYESVNQLIVDCLHSDCYVSHQVRQEIEDTLFLPWQGETF